MENELKDIRIGDWHVRQDSLMLIHSHRDVKRKLEPRVFELLEYFINNSDSVVTVDDLLKDVWKVQVEKHAVYRALYLLRTALSVEKEEVIETIPRKGYKLLLSVNDGSFKHAQQNNGFESVDKTIFTFVSSYSMLLGIGLGHIFK